eukprot:TRINITY_DN4544_c0_g1_i2.p1 TRINITY_DN4544_c0_g1~~TRINITY_DN4544_c0_g1_i2.p1  ORF type:complete len:793 (-),score=198.76 TRINITY_DN4544_c0_g1_i2:53-2431(-)
MSNFQHLPTTKHINKPFKSKHRTKGDLKRTPKAPKNRKPIKATKNSTKADQRRRTKERIKKQREELIQKNRSSKAPKLVAFFSLSPSLSIDDITKPLFKAAGREEFNSTITSYPHKPITLTVAQFKTRLCFYQPKRDIIALLDTLKVADLLVVGIDPITPVDDHAKQIVSALKAQGIPNVIGVISGLAQHPNKKSTKLKKKELTQILEEQFPNLTHVVNLKSTQDASILLRHVCLTRVEPIIWREKRPYLLVEEMSFRTYPDSTGFGVLSVSGYLRGNKLNPNYLVHFPDYGDFQISQVSGPPDPNPSISRSEDSMNEKNQILGVSNPSERESLNRINEPSPFEGEQTWPTTEEILQTERESRILQKRKKVPKGTSEYQAAWLMDDDEDELDDDLDDEEDLGNQIMKDEENNDGDEELGFGLTSLQLEKLKIAEEEYEKDIAKEGDPLDTLSQATRTDIDDRDIQFRNLRDFKKDAEDEIQWPDEVFTPEDIPASVRFRKYRGLASFRTSPWDPKENLPPDYAKIFQFQNFSKARKRIEKTHDGIESGRWVTIDVIDVPSESIDRHPSDRPLVLCGLFKYENKMSVVNFNVIRSPLYLKPIRSKEDLIFHVGFRRYKANPLFSDNSLADKHKLEKFFLPSSKGLVATVFAPLTFPPAPLLVFKQFEEELKIVATGSILDINPDRLIIKRIVLTGRPFKINKNRVVMRDMFHNPEDVNWFKPVQLWTKYGRVGEIKESLGTHGKCKCFFEGIVQAQDTICMSLYKRVFPQWVTFFELDKPGSQKKEDETKMIV